MVSVASVWLPRIAALVLSTTAAWSVAYWGLHWRLNPAPQLAAISSGEADHSVDGAAVAKALGASGEADPVIDSPPPRASDISRFVLQGVLGGANAGSALIAVDGKPPKPVRVGAVLADDWTLRHVQGRRAVLSRQGVDLELTLPPLPVPATLTQKTP